MIRFKTIDPAEQAKAADKAGEKPAAKPATVAPPAAEPAEDGDAAAEEPAAKGKGMTRKTPLRAKKPDAARLFRD
ncbi:hypothetical protein [Bosea sp. (in: a-proteobacteria)]|jgi:hypothetical protein|uniref:hypothetical protein n=1 Tax=Bosea sp. (in: a-proteobacteria) TaxID=1871050 RepID=UPI002732AC8B|nr:hypothetical protein [Bosea sp. (in: a-proteobacteria)]MDP3406820.1 hypothetical protein [Bosea sp. (in: a-proteobacteria)]